MDTTFTVLEQGWGGLKDNELWPRIRSEAIFFVTADKGFGDLRVYPIGSHAGILLLRPARERRSDFVSLVEFVLDKNSLESLSGCLVVATVQRIRIRRPDQESTR